jgi:hypothetical protein
MSRSIRIGLGIVFLSLISPGSLRAQGWGWEGWGGWTSTPEGSLAQGMGHYYTGAGIFNERTAIADSIDADTMMRWNDYIYQANKAREDANKFLKTFAGLVRLLERPDTTEAFNQLRTIKSTTLSNLIAFMEIYNLRFGAATTPRQRAVYRDLFAKVDAVRDQVVKGSNRENQSILSNLDPVFDFFGQLFRF